MNDTWESRIKSKWLNYLSRQLFDLTMLLICSCDNPESVMNCYRPGICKTSTIKSLAGFVYQRYIRITHEHSHQLITLTLFVQMVLKAIYQVLLTGRSLAVVGSVSRFKWLNVGDMSFSDLTEATNATGSTQFSFKMAANDIVSK